MTAEALLRADRVGAEALLRALVGPTSSGKTEVGVAVAAEIGAEIVCADSMTVYLGMDVGTAKPSHEQRAAVPHHLLDLCDPGEPFAVARFQRSAREAIEEIRARGRLPLVVGGSGLYLRAVLDEFGFPPTDPAVRRRLEAESTDALLGRLREADPEAAARIEPRNRRRIVRALEVLDLTGRPFSSFRADWDRFDPRAIIAGLDVPADILAERISERARRMFGGGLLDEVRALDARGYRAALTAPQAIGYREALAHLDGRITLAEAIDGTIRSTRRLARRQMSWFRRDPRVQWFDGSDPERAASRIRAYYEERRDEVPA